MNPHQILKGAALAALVLIPSASQAQSADAWQYRASIYAWFPAINGDTQFPSGAGGPQISVSAGDVLSSLKMTFMGTAGAKKGQWGVWTDVFYADVGATKAGSRDFTVGHRALPAGIDSNLSLDLKAWLWTIAGTYQLSHNSENTTDLVFGARMLHMDQTLDYAFTGDIASVGLPARTGRAEVDATNWDAVLGVKGEVAITADRRWFLPYYLDIGAGQSKFTWQALVGVAYAFDWGATSLAWRYLDYEFKSDSPIQNIDFSGPFLGLTFRW
jgi:hypothetical protein